MKDIRGRIERLLDIATEKELERIYLLIKAVVFCTREKAGVENVKNEKK